MQAVTSHAAHRLPEFATQAVSNTVWGCATLEFYNDKFYEAAAADIMREHPIAISESLRLLC